jgi:purine nucleosidase
MKRTFYLITLIVLSIGQFTAAAESKKIIIDCDPGIDDAMAITLAMQYSSFEIVGITTVFGNASVEHTTKNALRMVELSDKKIPVYKGAEKPLRIPLAAFPDFIHGKDGLGNSNQPDPKTLRQTKPAAKFIVDITKAYPGQITILAIGALTNVAEAIKLDSDVIKNVREVVLIGGALHVPGNVSPVAEANIAGDPDAADIVFTAPWKVTMIGLDVISKVKINATLISRIKNGNKRYGAFIFSITRFTFDFLQNVIHTKEGPSAYDPTAVMYLIDSSLFTTIKGPVRVVTTGIASGETIMPVNPGQLQLPPWTEKPFVTAAMDVDARRFLKTYELIMIPK